MNAELQRSRNKKSTKKKIEKNQKKSAQRKIKKNTHTLQQWWMKNNTRQPSIRNIGNKKSAHTASTESQRNQSAGIYFVCTFLLQSFSRARSQRNQKNGKRLRR